MKKITINFLSLLAFSLTISIAYGQQPLKKEGNVQQFGRKIQLPSQELTPSGHIRCYTSENEAFLKAQYPNRATDAEFEAWLAPKIAQIQADRAAGRNVQQVYNIPVVIHIVHNGDAIGTGENITDAQAISQITVMNQDFRRLSGTRGGANTTGLAVDCEINFCLAQTDPNGNFTTGIVRHNIAPYSNNVTNGSGGADWETRTDVETMKAATIWDPTQYLNMWTIRPGGLSLQNGGLTGLLGYAQFPSNSGLGGLNANGGAADTDGVVAGFDAMGTIDENDGTFILNGSYNLGRTMTHEVGHWIGLRHIWGDGGCTVDDFCADTPVAGSANYNCGTVDTCPTEPGNDMYQNYMDYTYDNCMDTFTQNQKDRMIAVMTNSPRRNTLNASTKCQAPAPFIQFNQPTGSINEGTNCSFVELTVPVTIVKAPSASATITFNVTGGTATQNADYTIINPTATFAAGATASQNLTVRVNNDGLAEGNENIIITMTLNANGGDAILNEAGKSITISIIDNDFAPNPLTTTTLLNGDFETTTGWTVRDGDGDAKNWGVLNNALNGYGTAPNTISGQCGFSEKSLTYLGGTGSATPNNYINSPQITIPTGATAVNLSYIVGAYDNVATGPVRKGGDISVYFTTNITSEANILAGTLIQAAVSVNEATTQLFTHNLLTLAGQTGYIVFRHTNNTGSTALLLLDSVILTATIQTPVQTEVNTGTAYQALVPAAGTFYATDATSGRIMVAGTNTAFNYGCTSVSVNRSITSAGAAAVNYGANTANNLKVMAKSLTITPATNNVSGNNSITFYFTEAEIAGWEAATGNNRSALRVIKDGNALVLPATIGAFGTGNVTLTTTVANGLEGTYYFGIETTLNSSSFEIVNAITVYPNPTSNELNINLGVDFNTATNYTIYNNLGQTILSKK
ncbi:MAG: M43 family zinc metalloprotease, partial [Bacteroidia bacterium]